MSETLLRELNRVKAVFQLRAITTALQLNPVAKATEGKAGMAVGEAHVRRSTAGTGLRVGEAGADQPATSEHMDVTAGETAPNFVERSA